MSTIKINRAARISRTGQYPQTLSALMQAIPVSVIKAITSRQLAELIDAVAEVAETSKHLAAREALENGFVWDEDRNIARDIV